MNIDPQVIAQVMAVMQAMQNGQTPTKTAAPVAVAETPPILKAGTIPELSYATGERYRSVKNGYTGSVAFRAKTTEYMMVMPNGGTKPCQAFLSGWLTKTGERMNPAAALLALKNQALEAEFTLRCCDDLMNQIKAEMGE